MKTILVPTDFSKNAGNALDYAIAIAKKEKAKIILLHAFNISYINGDAPVNYFAEQLAVVEEAAAKRLKALQSKVQKSKVICETINREGNVIDIVPLVVKKNKIDLIIMGTKGASGVKEILIGSNATKVMSNARCPVIVVPEKASFAGIKKIAFATDYHSGDVAALKTLSDIAKVFNSVIKVVHVTDGLHIREKEDIYLKKLEKKVKQKVNYKKIGYQLLCNSEVENELEQFVKKETIDLLGVSTKDRNMFEKLFGKSITKKLSYHIKVPLIVFHYK
jgi:nucleotide-binding universal stress UspA family protein